MNNDFLIKCGNCNKFYNDIILPKVINCGHTICIVCITNIIKKNKNKYFICPDDKKKIIIKNSNFLENIPTNHLILNMIKKNETSNNDVNYENSEFEIISKDNSFNTDKKTMNLNYKNHEINTLNYCNKHLQKLDIVCLEKTCEEKICSNCALFGNHKNHKIIQKEEFLYKMNDKIDIIMKLYESIKSKEININSNEFLENIKNWLVNKKNNLEKEIIEYYDNIIDEINDNRINLFKKFNKLFEKYDNDFIKKKNLNSNISNKISLWKTKTIKIIQNYTNNENSIDNCFEIINILNSKNIITKGNELDKYLIDLKDNIINNLTSSLENITLTKNHNIPTDFININVTKFIEKKENFNGIIADKNIEKDKYMSIKSINKFKKDIEKNSILKQNNQENLLKLDTNDIHLLNSISNLNKFNNKTRLKNNSLVSKPCNTSIIKKSLVSKNNFFNNKLGYTTNKFFNKTNNFLNIGSIKSVNKKRNNSFLKNKKINPNNVYSLKNLEINEQAKLKYNNENNNITIIYNNIESQLYKNTINLSNYDIDDIIILDIFKKIISLNSDASIINLSNNNISSDSLSEIKDYLILNNDNIETVILESNPIIINKYIKSIIVELKENNINLII